MHPVVVFGKLLTVLGLGAIELWAAVPAGLAMGLPPWAAGGVAAGGAMLGVLAVVLLGEQVRARLIKVHSRRAKEGHSGVVHRLWHRYGVVGLGLLAPLLTGAPLGAALGLALGAPARRLLLWMGIGVVLWASVLSVAGALGLAGIRTLIH